MMALGLARKRGDRIVEQLRRHPRVGGRWSYDVQMNEYVRDDGVKAYARSHCSISVGGCESYYSVWYVEWPVAGPIEENDGKWGVLEHGGWNLLGVALVGFVEHLEGVWRRRTR